MRLSVRIAPAQMSVLSRALLKALPVVLGASVLLSGCSSIYTADEIAKLQAPDPSASRARNLMAVFDYDVPDRLEDGEPVFTRDPKASASGDDTTQAIWGMPNVRAVVEASIQSVDPLLTPHYFGFVPATEAADEKAVVRRMAAYTVMETAEVFARDGWRFAWSKPYPREMSLSYVVTQDIYFEKPGTGCKIPADLEARHPGTGDGCRISVLVRSRDVNRGRFVGESGFERVPAWIAPTTPDAWRVRSVLLLSTQQNGVPFLTTERQRALALNTKGLIAFYGLNEKGVPFIGEAGRIERFTASAEAVKSAERVRAEAEESLGKRVQCSVSDMMPSWSMPSIPSISLWPFGDEKEAEK